MTVANLYRFANRASSILAASISSTDTTLTLGSGAGASFPAMLGGQACVLALIAPTFEVEYVLCTEIVGDTMTVIRAAEGTAALAFPAGSRVELRLTAAQMESFVQKTGATMTGPIDMNGQPILNAVFSGNMMFEVLHAALIRHADVPVTAGYSAGERAIYLPPSRGHPAVDSFAIITMEFMRHIVFDAWIDINNLPPYFKLCDGTNGTPDLRGRFIKGATPGTEEQTGFVGGGHWYSTDESGYHVHGNYTGGTHLAHDQVPPVGITTGTVANTMVGGAANRLVSAVLSFLSLNAPQPHYHAINGDGVHAHNVVGKVEPPFFCMAKVMLNL